MGGGGGLVRAGVLKNFFYNCRFFKTIFKLFSWLACGCWLLASGLLFLASFSKSVDVVDLFGLVLGVELGC